jgi:hypothetical protein
MDGRTMRFSSNQHMEKRLDERAKKDADPEKAKKQAAMARVFRLLAAEAAKQGAEQRDGGDRRQADPGTQR